jgi:hypothetical protein
MGLSPAEFGRLRPSEFFAMPKRYREKNEAENLKHASLLATIINTSFYRPKRTVRPEDLISVTPSGDAATRSRRMTAKRQREIAEGIAKFFEGS